MAHRQGPVAWCLQHVPFEGPAQLQPLLSSRGYELRVLPVFERVRTREDLPEVEPEDLVVLTGGPMSVNDEARWPWLRPEKEWAALQVERGRRLLGICLGSQVIASALGAAIRPNPYREIGWFALRAESDDVLASILVEPSEVLHWHGERWDLPPGARLLASSEACDHQAYAIGSHVIGLQMHLEMTSRSAQDLCDHCPDDLLPAPYVQSVERIVGATSSFGVAHDALERLLDHWLQPQPPATRGEHSGEDLSWHRHHPAGEPVDRRL